MRRPAGGRENAGDAGNGLNEPIVEKNDDNGYIHSIHVKKIKGGTPMSLEENKALIRRVYELFNRRELDKYLEVFAPEYVEHYPSVDMSLERAMEAGKMFIVAFPDVISTIEDIIAEGDKVAFRVKHRGTHKGVFMGIAPTGNKIEMTNTVIGRVAGDKCAECWVTMDMFNLMQQLGAIPKR
jgi:predicted ester cyclase